MRFSRKLRNAGSIPISSNFFWSHTPVRTLNDPHPEARMMTTEPTEVSVEPEVDKIQESFKDVPYWDIDIGIEPTVMDSRKKYSSHRSIQYSAGGADAT